MDIEALKTEVSTEVQEKAEELAKDKIRSLTLARKRAENLVASATKQITELDAKIAEVKIEDFTEAALRDVGRKEQVNKLLVDRLFTNPDVINFMNLWERRLGAN